MKLNFLGFNEVELNFIGVDTFSNDDLKYFFRFSLKLIFAVLSKAIYV